MTDKLLTDQELSEATKFIPPPSQATRAQTQKQTPKNKGGMSDTVLRDALTNSFEFLGAGISFVDEFDAEVINNKAAKMADALVELSKTNPRVRAVLEQLTGVGAWSGVIMVFGAEVALPIMVHHSLLPEPMNGYLAAQGEIPVKGEKLASVREMPNDRSSRDTE